MGLLEDATLDRALDGDLLGPDLARSFFRMESDLNVAVQAWETRVGTALSRFQLEEKDPSSNNAQSVPEEIDSSLGSFQHHLDEFGLQRSNRTSLMELSVEAAEQKQSDSRQTYDPDRILFSNMLAELTVPDSMLSPAPDIMS